MRRAGATRDTVPLAVPIRSSWRSLAVSRFGLAIGGGEPRAGSHGPFPGLTRICTVALMGTWPEARAKHDERIRRQGRERVRRELMRVGPPCPRCGKPTQAKLVETSGDRIHPSCYTVAEEPVPRIVDLPPL